MSVIPRSIYTGIGSHILKPLDKTLKRPSNDGLASKIRFTGHLEKNKFTTKEEIYVVKGLHKPLLGRPAIKDLNLSSRIDYLIEGGWSVLDKFRSVFNNLGKMKGD